MQKSVHGMATVALINCEAFFTVIICINGYKRRADIVCQPCPAVGEFVEWRQRRRRLQQSTILLHTVVATDLVSTASVNYWCWAVTHKLVRVLDVPVRVAVFR